MSRAWYVLAAVFAVIAAGCEALGIMIGQPWQPSCLVIVAVAGGMWFTTWSARRDARESKEHIARMQAESRERRGKRLSLAEEMRPWTGQWVAVSDDHVIEHGETLAVVVAALRERGVTARAVLRVPVDAGPVKGAGW
jgi:hypothetical protein